MGGLLIAPVALAAEGLPDRLTWSNVAGFGYLSLIGALLAYAVWFRGIERLPALTVSLLGFASPLAATVLGFLFLRQGLTPIQGAGAIAVIGAVLLAQRSSAREPLEPDPPLETAGSGTESPTAAGPAHPAPPSPQAGIRSAARSSRPTAESRQTTEREQS